MVRANAWASVAWIAVAFFGVAESRAMPLADPVASPAAIFPFEELLPSTGVDFTSIIALDNCSAALVRLDSSLPTDRALAMTNGHCNQGGFIAPGVVVVDKPSTRSMKLLSSDGKGVLGLLKADRVVYGTMTRTDMLIYRLTQTYEEIERRYGVRGLTLSSRHPTAGRPIAVVSGYWRRIFRCSIERFIYELREDNWVCNDSIRYSSPGCETIGGTSGAPIVDVATGEVVGINNTGNDDGERCTEGNPCEVDQTGDIVAEKGVNYGQQTYWVYGCLTADNQLDLARPGCMLPR